MDFTQLLETSVVTGGMGTVLFYLNSKAQTDSDIAVLGYMSCSFLLILLHQVAPLFHASPVEKTEDQVPVLAYGVASWYHQYVFLLVVSPKQMTT